MAVKGNDTAFSTSEGKARAVILTDSSGNIYSTATDAPNIYKVIVENEAVTDFYLDYNGNEYQEPLNVAVWTSGDIPIKVQYGLMVENKFREKTGYLAEVAAAKADDESTTGYAPGEFIPKGTKHLMRVTTGEADSGEYTVYAYAMSARY